MGGKNDRRCPLGPSRRTITAVPPLPRQQQHQYPLPHARQGKQVVKALSRSSGGRRLTMPFSVPKRSTSTLTGMSALFTSTQMTAPPPTAAATSAASRTAMASGPTSASIGLTARMLSTPTSTPNTTLIMVRRCHAQWTRLTKHNIPMGFRCRRVPSR